MSNRTRKVLWTFTVSLTLAAGAPCGPGPVFDVADLVAKSDLVPIGQILSVEEKLSGSNDVTRHDANSHLMTATMQVDQWLKGRSGSSQITFDFVFPVTSGVPARSYRMVFLKKESTGFTFTSDYYPSVPSVPKVALRPIIPIENVIEQLQAVTQKGNFNDKQQALYALQTLRFPEATAALKLALQDKTPNLNLIAAAALLERNDISAMPIAERALVNRPREVPPYFLHNIAYAISQGVSDERAVSALLRLIRVPDLETRRAAASALWHTHSRSAISGLIQALNDEDFEVRFYGVVALAEITGEVDWHPNMESFHQDETKYLQHWREWSNANYPATVCCLDLSSFVPVFAQEQSDSQLDADIARLDVLRSANNLDALRMQIDLDSEKWRSSDRNAFLLYMYRACGELSSYDIGDISQRALLLGQYSISVLRSGDIPLPQYVQFVEFLGFDPPVIDESAWKELRRQKAQFWLEAWRRVTQATDPKFDLDDRPLLNVAPPLSAGVPAGASPASIKDPQLRTEYEKAIAQNSAKAQRYNKQAWLKRNGPRVYKDVEHYLMRAYAQAPSDIPELQRLLSDFIEDASVRDRLLAEARKSQHQ